jgi:HK97 gp10 family phage protein
VADSIDVTFGDLNLLAFDLSRAGEEVVRRGDQVMRKGAADVERVAKQLVPVDTSATQNSIGSDPVRDSGGGEFGYVIGPTTSYAPFLEMGTSRMAPRAFMGPAADLVGPEVSAALGQLGAEVMRR